MTYLLWVTQIDDFWGNILLFVSGFNFWLFIINLIPAFPMDGGRWLRSILPGLGATPELAVRLLRSFGFIVAAALVGWGLMLLLQHSRFSLETAIHDRDSICPSPPGRVEVPPGDWKAYADAI